MKRTSWKMGFVIAVVIGAFLAVQAEAADRLTMGSWKKGSGWHV